MEGDLSALLGLGKRAGSLIIGTGGVRAALKKSQLQLVIVAKNYSDRTGEKVVRLARAKKIPVVAGLDTEELGSRLGLGPVQAVGVTDLGLAAGIRQKTNPLLTEGV
ncbi:MAG: ribosomal L7Ae/L30e/S12e/Gadd45 family protein [Gemmatimonadetes bacterium]|nr:ribosomal L7Ae/L30e/S12e/Gadd45 family protein [Gemmatimonadota bacterium]